MTGRLTKRTLREVTVLDTEDLNDERQRAIQQIASIADTEAIELVHKVFLGTSLLENEAKINAVLNARRAIYEYWGRVRENFVAIGRSLLRLETQFTATEIRRLYESSDRLFPFSASLASQFRQIARAAEGGKLPEPQLPGTYTVAYQLAILTESELALARERNLIRPNVRRSEVLTF